jgi:hypothetical protein
VAEQRRGHVKDQREEDLAQFGVPAEQARAWIQHLDADDAQPHDSDPSAAGGPPVVLWPENHDVWRLWMRLQRRWERGQDGRLYSLRFGEVESAVRLMKLWRRSAELFDQLTDMQDTVLDALEEQEATHGA